VYKKGVTKMIKEISFSSYFVGSNCALLIQKIIEDYNLENEFENKYNMDINGISEEWIDEMNNQYIENYIDSEFGFLEWILHDLFNNLEDNYAIIESIVNYEELIIIVEFPIKKE
jgi:hypothetical protein